MNRNVKPTRAVCKVPNKMNTCDIVKNRELGLKRKIGFEDGISTALYTKLDRYKLKIPKVSEQTQPSGGIFNLEFGSDGHLMVAACEHRCIMLYDAGNQKHIKTVEDAHISCVNCVKFLSDRTFATGSDDNSIKLWDIRQLNSCVKTLYGHSNWVKNIEYSESDNMMLSSAFDGSVYAWHLNSPTENSFLYSKVFVMSGLMRTKLSPDGTKMIISTTNGYLIIIHDLDLKNLGNEYRSFRPIVYRLMQTSHQNFPAGTVFNYLFHPGRRKNRVEFIDDFPNDAEIISSLQIHPHGWSALSRNMNSEENEEWTCVHDIQKRDPSDYEEAFMYIEEETEHSDSEEHRNQRPTDLWMGYISSDQYNPERHNTSDIYESTPLPAMGIINSGLIGRNNYDSYFEQHPEHKNKVVTNLPRLTHYAKEKNVGKGYIKELCFSSDGRIICSPYDKGVRLLGFNNRSQELTYCVPDRPQKLTTLVEMNNYHKDVVVSCKFNPMHLQLVSGCLSGNIVWYKPIL